MDSIEGFLEEEREIQQQAADFSSKATENVGDEIEFLLEEEAKIAKELQTETKSFSPQKPVKKSYICEECGKMAVCNTTLQQFQVKVCYDCKKTHRKYKLMAKSTANDEYLLTEKDLKRLNSITVRNPRREGWNRMRLYITFEIEAKCIEKFGSLDKMEKEKLRRTKTRIRKKEAALNKESKSNMLEESIKRLRAEAKLNERKERPKQRKTMKQKLKTVRNSQSRYVKRTHTHAFDEERLIEGTLWEKICKECGMKVEFERL